MASAPGTLLTSGGWSRNGMFSLNTRLTGNGVGGGNGGRLMSDGRRDASAIAPSRRNTGLRRTISMIEPPGTFGTPALIAGSTPRKIVP